METTTVETSTQGNLEVTPVANTFTAPEESDWASRLDQAMENINTETGDTKYGKADEGKTASEKRAEKVKPVKEKTPKVSDKKEPVVNKSEESEVTEPEEDKSTDESKKEAEPASEETPRGLTEKAAVKWGELRNENRAQKKEIESLKAELEKAKTAAPEFDPAEVERLRQINQAYEQELSVARVEATAEYKQNVYEPMVNVIGYLNELAGRYELNSKDMLAAFAETDGSKQSDLVADIAASMNERDRLRFYAANDDYNEIIRRRDYYQSTSRERLAQIEQQRQAEVAKQQQESWVQKQQAEKSAAEAKAAYEKASEKVFDDLKKQVPVLSDEEIAADVQRLAKGDYTNAAPELKSYLAHSGALMPHLLKALKAAKADLDKANKTIAGYRNSSPKAGSGSAETSKDIPENIGFLEALDQQLG
jgi:hypothetical protein